MTRQDRRRILEASEAQLRAALGPRAFRDLADRGRAAARRALAATRPCRRPRRF